MAKVMIDGGEPMGDKGFWLKHRAKLVAVLFWGVLLGGYYLYAHVNELTVRDSVTLLATFLTGSLLGPLFYIGLYTLRPIIFFPATALTLLGGFLFGPIGLVYTIVGANASAMVAYGIGWYLGEDLLQEQEGTGFIQRYTKRMRENSFETVLLMRLLFLPYDVVNYAAGVLKINWQGFLWGTVIGSLPGTVSFVLLGTSFGTLDDLLAGNVSLDPKIFAFSVALVAVSIGISQYLKRRGGDEVEA
ncbi:MAG TPA: TVP38/TMEM64 family protein [Anaerolineae bacterium]|nr:TVP38/TMEM64 family protein [Anaerolineae bacterium]